MQLTEQQIQEIAGELEAGLRSFVHRKTGAILQLPPKEALDMEWGDIEPWQEVLDMLEAHREEYIAIEQMSSHEGFGLMADFTELLPVSSFQQRLIDALNRHKPFRNFKALIDDSDYRQAWFDYQQQAYISYVKKALEYELPTDDEHE